MSNQELCLTYLQHYAHKNLDAVAAMFADGITLRDWNICVHGKAAAISETRNNFAAAKSIEIQALHVHESADTVAAELRILVDGHTELHVVDVITFDAEGKIVSIRAYLGRGEH